MLVVRPPLALSRISELSPAALKVFALHFGIPSLLPAQKKFPRLPAVSSVHPSSAASPFRSHALLYYFSFLITHFLASSSSTHQFLMVSYLDHNISLPSFESLSRHHRRHRTGASQVSPLCTKASSSFLPRLPFSFVTFEMGRLTERGCEKRSLLLPRHTVQSGIVHSLTRGSSKCVRHGGWVFGEGEGKG